MPNLARTLFDPVGKTAQIDHWVNQAYTTSYILSAGQVTLTARPNDTLVSREDFEYSLLQIRKWIAMIRQEGFTPAKVPVTLSVEIKKNSETVYSAEFSTGGLKISEISWNGSVLTFEGRPERVITFSAFERWFKFLERVLEDIS